MSRIFHKISLQNYIHNLQSFIFRSKGKHTHSVQTSVCMVNCQITALLNAMYQEPDNFTLNTKYRKDSQLLKSILDTWEQHSSGMQGLNLLNVFLF